MRLLSIFILVFFMVGCGNSSMEDNLSNGLKYYRKKRYINKELVSNYGLQEVAFFKKDSLSYDFVFKLSENSVADTIGKYGFGLVYFTSDGSVGPEGYRISMMKSEMKMVGDYKYIIENVTPPANYLDSIHIFITGRDGYTGVIGNMAILRNIQLK